MFKVNEYVQLIGMASTILELPKEEIFVVCSTSENPSFGSNAQLLYVKSISSDKKYTFGSWYVYRSYNALNVLSIKQRLESILNEA